MLHAAKVLSLICAIGVICGSAAGCSGLIAKGPTAAAIYADAGDMSLRCASTQPAADIAINAARFDFYSRTATVNFLAWVFDPEKTIYATAVIYGDLQEKRWRSAEMDRRMKSAATRPAEVVRPALWLQTQAAWMAVIKREKDGN